MSRWLRRLASLALMIVLAASAACGTQDDAPGGNGGPPLHQDQPAATPVTRPTATTASPCPAEASLEVKTKNGDRVLTATRAYADITGDASATITIANYDLSADEASKVFQPSLTGDQLSVHFVVTATGGQTLGPGRFVPPRSTTSGTGPVNQLNTYSVWSSAGREITSGFNQISPEVTITSIDHLQVCGEITTPEARGRFVAART